MPGDLGAAPQPGGVDRTIRRPSNSSSVSIASRVVPASSETITRSEPRKRVDERGLADVRPADHRDPRRARPLIVGASGRRPLGAARDEPVEQVAGAEAVGGRDGQRLAEPERVELGRQRLVAGLVDLVGDDDHRQRRRGAGSRRPRRRPGAGRRGRRRTSATASASAIASRAWRLDRPRERVVGGEVDAAGVDQLEADARSTRSRAPCGRGSRRARRGRPPRGRPPAG